MNFGFNAVWQELRTNKRKDNGKHGYLECGDQHRIRLKNQGALWLFSFSGHLISGAQGYPVVDYES